MDSHQYLWDHFKFNADQRLKAFNFFAIFSLAADGGLITVLEKSGAPAVPLVVIGLFIVILSLSFFIIDQKSKELIDIAVPGLKELEGSLSSSAISGETQPDDLRQISVPLPTDNGLTARIAGLAQQASAIQKQLLPLRMAGWNIGEHSAASPAIIPIGIPTLSFDRARIKWGLVISGPSAKVHKLVRSGHRLFAGKQEVAKIAVAEPEEAIEWLRRQLLTFPEGTTLGEIEAIKPLVPETPALAEKALALILQEEQRVADLLAQIKKAKQEISDQLETLFERVDHPPIK